MEGRVLPSRVTPCEPPQVPEGRAISAARAGLGAAAPVLPLGCPGRPRSAGGSSARQKRGKTNHAPSGKRLSPEEPHVGYRRARGSSHAAQAPVWETSSGHPHPHPARSAGRGSAAAQPRTAGGASEAASGRKRRAAVATCDVRRPSRALAATAALDARGDAGVMRRETTKSRPAAAGRNGSPGASGARGERSSSNAAGRVLALASPLWDRRTAEHDANRYH